MGSKGTKVTVYFSCIGKGQVLMPVSLKHLQHQMKHSKVSQDLSYQIPESLVVKEFRCR